MDKYRKYWSELASSAVITSNLMPLARYTDGGCRTVAQSKQNVYAKFLWQSTVWGTAIVITVDNITSVLVLYIFISTNQRKN